MTFLATRVRRAPDLVSTRRRCNLIRQSFLAFAACLTITLFSLPGTVSAQTQQVEALVNNAPISTFAIQQRARFIEVTARVGGTRAQQMALEELIEEELKIQEARRLGISVSDEQVNERLGQMAGRINLDVSGLTRAFSEMGVDTATLRRRIRADLLWSNIVRQAFRQEVRVREQDVLMALSEREDRGIATTTEFNLQQVVFFTVRGTSTSEGRNNADVFRSRFTGCDTTAEILREFVGAAFKNLGRATLDEMDDEVRAAVGDVLAGGTSIPLVGEENVTVFAVCSRREIEDDGVARREVEQEIRTEEGQRLARRLLMDVRQRSTIEYR